jgi:hypothetical protein
MILIFSSISNPSVVNLIKIWLIDINIPLQILEYAIFGFLITFEFLGKVKAHYLTILLVDRLGIFLRFFFIQSSDF